MHVAHLTGIGGSPSGREIACGREGLLNQRGKLWQGMSSERITDPAVQRARRTGEKGYRVFLVRQTKVMNGGVAGLFPKWPHRNTSDLSERKGGGEKDVPLPSEKRKKTKASGTRSKFS